MSDQSASTPEAAKHPPHQAFWLWVMCLTGVDYFSTLGYQPSIAFSATGLLTPLATVILVLVTLLGALPVYSYVAGQSPHGQGSIGMLERLVRGWLGKTMLLVLLGFAATDFVITKTLSAADAAQHLIANPYWPFATPAPEAEPPPTEAGDGAQPTAGGEARPNDAAAQATPDRDQDLWQRLVVTMVLLVLLGAMFLRGFREVIGLAVVIVGTYLFLNLIIVGSGLVYLAEHPGLLTVWYENVTTGNWFLPEPPLRGTGWLVIAGTCLLLFPKLALGLSGFETGVAVMPLVRGKPNDDPGLPAGRIRNTRNLLITAALVMSTFLHGSALVTSTLIPPKELTKVEVKDPVSKEVTRTDKGRAVDRALAYLAHDEGPHHVNPLFGTVFGTLYDLSTVVILWFAGASAMAGLLNLVPQYLPRYGMAPEWARAVRPLVILLTLINLLVTWIFNADVEAQGGAYATGVLVLMSSACVATVIGRWRRATGPWFFRVPWAYLLITVVFLYTTAANIYEKPAGIQIASVFIVCILASSIASRMQRSTELRFQGFQFADDQSRFLWDSMRGLEFPVLVPHRPGRRPLADKDESIRKEHRIDRDVPIVFLEVQLGDPSDFYLEPVMEVKHEAERFILKISRCASVAHTIAAVGLELSRVGRPPEIHFGWSDESPVAANLGFLLFGEGNVPWMVRELIRRAEPNPERQPRIVIG